MDLIPVSNFLDLPPLNLAVVGHVEWVSFISVEELPKEGLINHAKGFREEPAGGGAVSALQLSRLSKEIKVTFFTALGRDRYGELCIDRLNKLGISLEIAWKDKSTRRGISFVNSKGERSITVIGDRICPLAKDELAWHKMKEFDAVYVTATDLEGLKYCRNAKSLIVTPRIGLDVLKDNLVCIDALIGSNLDPYEKKIMDKLGTRAKLIIKTRGDEGGESNLEGRYKAFKLVKPIKDSYGCGDSFAAGVTAGIASEWSTEASISLGAQCGALCAEYFGPFPY